MPPGNEVTKLHLSAGLYGLDAIQRAATAFSHLAEVTVEPGTISHVVNIRSLETAGIDSIHLEFANWVLRAGAVARSEPE